MALDQQDLRENLERIFAGQEMEAACRTRDLGAIIRTLMKYGVTQGKIAGLTGISQGRLSEYKTGKRVPMAKSIFESVANGLDMPANLRRALGLAAAGEPGKISLSVQGNGLPTDTYELQLLAEVVGRGGESVRRRELLQLAGKIGSSAVMAQSEIAERLAAALARPNAMDESIVREIEARSFGFHRLEQLIAAPILFGGIAAHLREVSVLLSGTAADPRDELRHRLIVVAGESSTLAGWIAADKGDITTARSFYQTAERAAKEANDPEIHACVLGYRSYNSGMKGAHGRSRALLSGALEILSPTASPGTLSWIAARHAEESVALGDRSQALRSWAKAEEAYSMADPEEDRVWTRFLDQERFDTFRISTLAGVGKVDEAQELALTLLARLPQSRRQRSVIILETIATAYFVQGAVNETARLALQGLTALRETAYTIWLPKYEALGQGLMRWRNQPLVRAFLEDISMTKAQFGSSRG
ncbi:hypothetical protein Aple_059370 [Acrocarpospora pleiomorpha]|uniref:HTH cro/C1-type domain-containing protein n=1 Tax=Acrocarpospora pleiomorpha TaxID=90975 RepID=A0A5M3XXL1_9ACTN|nr:helix-turn-helix transcriptional regulator [Acrocarpospora pleiomorpha]GES23038.1 hypothetical protein Aple_059370 [Acrocarpospora pleiomorpha]